MSELKQSTIKWLQEYAISAIQTGLRTHVEPIDEETCKDLMEHELIQFELGKDGDQPWDKKAQLVVEWSGDLLGRLDIFRTVRETFTDSNLIAVQVHLEELLDSYIGSLHTDELLNKIAQEVIDYFENRVEGAKVRVEMHRNSDKANDIQVKMIPTNDIAKEYFQKELSGLELSVGTLTEQGGIENEKQPCASQSEEKKEE